MKAEDMFDHFKPIFLSTCIMNWFRLIFFSKLSQNTYTICHNGQQQQQQNELVTKVKNLEFSSV